MEPDKHCYGVRQSGSLVSGPLAVSIHSGPDAFRLRTLFVSIRVHSWFKILHVHSWFSQVVSWRLRKTFTMRGMVNLKYALEHRPEMRIRWPSYGYCGGGCTIVTLSSIFPTTSNLFGSLASDLGGVEQSIAAIATGSRRTEEGSGQEKTRPFLAHVCHPED